MWEGRVNITDRVEPQLKKNPQNKNTIARRRNRRTKKKRKNVGKMVLSAICSVT